MSQNEIIAKRLSELRKKSTFTQDEIAQKIHVKRATIANYEKGHRAPDYETLIALADIYGVSCDYIIRGVKSEFADINRVTGLSNEAIEKLSEYKDSLIYSKAIDYLLNHKELLEKISTYLFSFLYVEFKQSDYYKFVPIKKGTISLMNPEIAQKVAFSNLIEQFPFDKENVAKEIQKNKKLKDKMLFAMCKRAADFNIINYLLDIDDYVPESPDEYYNADEEDYLSEQQAIEEMKKRDEYLRNFLHAIGRDGEHNAHDPKEE